LFSKSDYITIHTPLNNETRKLVNAEALSWMKPTAVIVNTSRGPMVDTDALVAALKSHQISAAAIDVFEVEPPPTTLPLFALENCILTPHIGWASVEASWESARASSTTSSSINKANPRATSSIRNSSKRPK